MKHFHRDQLSPADQKIYQTIKQGLADFSPELVAAFPSGGLEAGERIMTAINSENPSLCFHGIDTRAACLMRSMTVYPQYAYTKGQAERLKSDMKNAVTKILSNVPAAATDYDKEKILHDYFVRNMTYSEACGFHEAHTVIGPLTKHTGVCEGFTKAMTLLLRKAGVPAAFVCGKSDFEDSGQGHSWNCVWIGGNPYHMDVTWDITLTPKGGPVRYDYFNLPDADINLDHSEYTAPACTERADNYFVREKLCAYGKPGLTALLEQMAARKPACFTFRLFSDKMGKVPDMDAIGKIIREELTKIKVSGYRVSVNQHQSVVMLMDVKYL